MVAYFTYLTKGNELCFVSGFMDWIQSALRHNQKEGVKLWLPANASKGSLRAYLLEEGETLEFPAVS